MFATIRRASSRVSSLAFEWRKNLAVALRKSHVGERFLLRQFTPPSAPKAYRRNWKELKGGTHHANRSENCCDTRRCRRNRRRQCGSSRGLVRLSSSLLPPSCLLSLLSPSLLRLLPLLPSSLSPSLLAPLVLARSFFSTASLWRTSDCGASDKAGPAVRHVSRDLCASLHVSEHNHANTPLPRHSSI